MDYNYVAKTGRAQERAKARRRNRQLGAVLVAVPILALLGVIFTAAGIQGLIVVGVSLGVVLTLAALLFSVLWGIEKLFDEG